MNGIVNLSVLLMEYAVHWIFFCYIDFMLRCDWSGKAGRRKAGFLKNHGYGDDAESYDKLVSVLFPELLAAAFGCAAGGADLGRGVFAGIDGRYVEWP